MSDAVLGTLVSCSLIAVGVILLDRKPDSVRVARATPKQLRQAGMLALLAGLAVAGVTISLMLRGR